MKANEFVRKFGWGESKALVSAQSWTMHQIALSTTVDTKELTRLVESYDVVNQYPSLDAAKERLQYFINWLAEDESHAEYAPEIGKFKQAIADVESCYD